MTGDLFVINSPRESSWISTVSDVASTWLWEHSNIICLLYTSLDNEGFTMSVSDGILISEILHDILDAEEEMGLTGQVEFIDLNGYARKKLASGDKMLVKACLLYTSRCV